MGRGVGNTLKQQFPEPDRRPHSARSDRDAAFIILIHEWRLVQLQWKQSVQQQESSRFSNREVSEIRQWHPLDIPNHEIMVKICSTQEGCQLAITHLKAQHCTLIATKNTTSQIQPKHNCYLTLLIRTCRAGERGRVAALISAALSNPSFPLPRSLVRRRFVWSVRSESGRGRRPSIILWRR